MAKSSRHRAMPRTPRERPAQPPAIDAAAGEPVAVRPAATPTGRKVPRPAAAEAPYLLSGTRCTAGHERGRELDAGRLGTVPSRKRARIGFWLVVWCVGGLAFLAASGLVSGVWWTLGAQVAVLWLAFTAIVVRGAGHRKRCWRTRTWRHAWGGLAPGGA